ncbi:MAG: hypothetical protein ACO1Q7_07755 [Gemmatimonas sp.]
MKPIRSRMLLAALMLLGLIASAPVNAQVTVGTPEMGSGNCFPLGCAANLRRYQQSYAASAFSAPISISALTLFRREWRPGTGSLPRGSYAFSLAYAARPFDSLSTGFDDNVVGTPTFFANLEVEAGRPATDSLFTIKGVSNFLYDPALGDLILEINFRNEGLEQAFFDADQTGRLMHRVSGGGSGGEVEASGLVTRFETDAVVVTPEPGSMVLLGAGLGWGCSGWPSAGVLAAALDLRASLSHFCSFGRIAVGTSPPSYRFTTEKRSGSEARSTLRPSS